MGIRTSTSPASEAARALSRQRWGGTRLDNLIAELSQRRDELTAAQWAELHSLVESDDDGEQGNGL